MESNTVTKQQKKEKKGVQQISNFEEPAQILENTRQALKAKGRCTVCWMPQCYCICQRIEPLRFKHNVRFFIFIHYLEYGNAGDAAKLLLNAAPSITSMFVFGVPEEEERLRTALDGCEDSALLLFPDDAAITICEFLEQHGPLPQVVDTGNESESRPFTVVMIDAPWARARRMMQHFTQEINSHIQHVKLHPRTLSVYARKQSCPGRVCTVEATALLLQECGEEEEVCDGLVACLQLNNKAKRMEFSNNEPSLWIGGPTMGHPAWYYGRKLEGKGQYAREDGTSFEVVKIASKDLGASRGVSA